MATIPQIRSRLLEVFPEKQADVLAHVVIEAHDDLVTQADVHKLTGVVADLAGAVTDLAEAQKRTEVRVEELAEAQKRTEVRVEELADAQRRTEVRVEELADAQRRTEVRVEELANAQRRTEGCVEELTGAQTRTEVTLKEVVQTQQKMLIRLDRLDGHVMEDRVANNLPAFMGREFRKCRVIDRAEFVESLEGRLPEEQLDDLMRADVIATAKRRDETVHLVVEASCTAAAEDIDRAVRRAAAVAIAGFTAIGIVACEQISPQTLAAAREHGLRVITNGWLLPEVA